MATIANYLPGVGLIAYAVYQALVLKDVAGAYTSVVNALAVFGVGGAVHATQSSIAKS
jgi:hypothetical protein